MSTFSNVGSLICQIIGTFCLMVSGWHLPERQIITKLHSRKRLILVFPHTSYWDFFITFFYMMAVPAIRPYLYTVVAARFFDHFGWPLRAIGCIPATRRDVKGQGFVDATAKFLLAQPESRVLISPEGTILHAEWRTGYYHLGKAIGADVVMAGVDFEAKRLVMGPVRSFTAYDEGVSTTETTGAEVPKISVTPADDDDDDEIPIITTTSTTTTSREKSFDEITAELQKDMEMVVPLNPEESYTKTRTHNCPDVGCIDPLVLTTCLFPLYPVYRLFYSHPLLALVGLSCVLASFRYHYDRERSLIPRNYDFMMTFFSIGVVTMTYYVQGLLHFDLFFLSHIALTAWTYYMAWGRAEAEQRTWRYVVFHSAFHILASSCVALPMYRAMC